MSNEEKLPHCYAEELRELFVAHSPMLFGRGCFLTRGDTGLAEDLVQDVFVAAAKDWATVRVLAPGQQRAWLWTTLTRKAISAFRKAEVRRRRTAEQASQRPPVFDPLEQAITAGAIQRLQEVIGSLPERQYMIAVMRWLEGMKEGEIAQKLGIAESTVGVQIFRIRKRLVAELRPYYPFGLDSSEGEAP